MKRPNPMSGRSAKGLVPGRMMAPSASAPRKKVLLVDEQPMMRRALTELLNAEKDLRVCGGVGDAQEAMKEIKARMPDLVLTDLALTGKHGLELIKEVRAQFPQVFILVISAHDETLYASRSLRAGANGYVMKSESGETILQAVRRVLAGAGYVSDDMSAKILDIYSGRTFSHSPIDPLTDREFEVFELIGQGKGSLQIARQLCLSPKTVDAHRGNIKKKLKLAKGAELVRTAVRWVESEHLELHGS
jgi:DNA-binding NarL/FixJ family response regulator